MPPVAATKPKKEGGKKATTAKTGRNCKVILRSGAKIVHEEELSQAAVMKWWPKLGKLLAQIEGPFTFTVAGERTMS